MILALIAYLAIVYNLNEMGGLIGVNSSTFPVLNIGITVAVLAVIFIGSIKQFPLAAHIGLWLMIYLVGRWQFYPGSAILGGNEYLSNGYRNDAISRRYCHRFAPGSQTAKN